MNESLLTQYEPQLAAKSPCTRALAHTVLSEFLAQAGSPPWSVSTIAMYLTRLISSANAGSTISTKMMVLRVFMRWASAAGYADAECAPMCCAPKYPQPVPRTATADEIELLLNTAGPRLRMPLLLAVHLGIRESEIRGLTWGAIDLNVGQATIIGKGSKLRVVPIVDEGLLMYLREQQGEASQYLVPGECGNMLTRGVFGKRLRLHCRELGIRELTPHSFRHAFASGWHKRGLAAREVQALLGHSSLVTTEHYLSALTGTESLRHSMMQHREERVG